MTLDPGWLLLAAVLALAVAVWAFQQARTVYRHRAVAEELRQLRPRDPRVTLSALPLQQLREMESRVMDFDRRRLLDDGVVGVGLAKRRVH